LMVFSRLIGQSRGVTELAGKPAPTGDLRVGAKPACAGWEQSASQAAQAAFAARRAT
jgi:hypothetical protein